MTAPRQMGGVVLVASEISPEAELRALFRAESAAEAELRRIRAELPRIRQRYAAKHSLLALPGFNRLRELFG